MKSIDRAIKIADSWNDAYKEFLKIVDKYFPDEKRIAREVENLYRRHKGNPDWETAWKKWNVDPDDYV